MGNNPQNFIDPTGLDGCNKKLPNGKCPTIPTLPIGDGEPIRKRPRMWSDPPPTEPATPTPTPRTPPTPGSTPNYPPSIPDKPDSPSECNLGVLRMPDFYTLGINIPVAYGIGWNPSITIDRHYQIYGTLFGASVPTVMPGGSINAGWILKRPDPISGRDVWQTIEPSADITRNYLEGAGVSVTGYFPPPYFFGGGYGHSSGGTAILVGAGYPPGISGSVGYNHRLR